MTPQDGQKIRGASAGEHLMRMLISVPIVILGLAGIWDRGEVIPFILVPLPMAIYTAYLLYADYNGGIWWNEDKIWKRKNDYRWFRATPNEADLDFADLTRVESEIHIPAGDIRMTDVYDHIALYGPQEGAPAVIKLGLQFHMKQDLVAFMDVLNTRYPEKCSDSIRAYIEG